MYFNEFKLLLSAFNLIVLQIVLKLVSLLSTAVITSG